MPYKKVIKMDLTFIAGNNISLLNKLEELDCDLDSLLYVAKDFFSLCDNLGLKPRQNSRCIYKT
jgi:hypothetical protein